MATNKDKNLDASHLKFKPYKAKKGEEHMSPAQVEHFRSILMQWKERSEEHTSELQSR